MRHSLFPNSLLVVALVLLPGCESSNPSRPQNASGVAGDAVATGIVATAGRSGNADDLMIVDCMLPGRIRRLGNMTYVTARQPVKTSALECNIRGGEYVAFDRADHATALRVWLEQGEAGDAQAQTYVGEIYEKGLGVDANYKAAARWYRRAAEQGFARAQINLGYLYENGLGVAKDRTEALSWYRRAAGEQALVFADTAPVAAAPVARVGRASVAVAAPTVVASPALQHQLAGEQQKAAVLQQELSSVQQQLRHQQQTLADAEQQLRQARSEVARQRDDAGQSSAEDAAPVAAATPPANALAAAAAAEQQAALQQQLAEAHARERALQQSVADEQQSSAAANTELLAARSQLDQYQQQLDAGQRQLGQQQAALQRSQQALDSERHRAVLGSAQQAELEQTLQQRQRDIAALQQQLAQASTLEVRLQQARQRQQQASQQLGVEARSASQLRKQLEDAKQALGSAETLVQQQSVTLQQLEQQQDTRIAALEQQLALRDSAAAQQLQREVSQHEAQLAIQRQRLGQLREDADDKVTGLANSLVAMQLSNQSLQRELTEQKQTVAALKAELASTRQTHSREQQALQASSQGDIRKLQQQLQLREQTLRSERERLSKLTTEAQQYQQQLARLQQSSGGAAVPAATVAVAATATTRSGGSGGGGSGINVQGIPFGNFYALVIGNNRYRNLKPLGSAVSDAQAVQQILQNRYGFRTTLLVDATRYDIISAFNQLREKLTENDNLLVYYAGHGELERSNTKGYWLPVDAEQNSNANWISNGSITEIISTLSARHVLVVADSCYSGSLTRSSVAQLPKGISADKRRKYLQIMVGLRSRTVLTSGGLSPVLDAGTGGHSVFAQAFLDALRGSSGVLEGQQLFGQVFQRVRAESKRLDLEQFPEYAPLRFAGHESGDFFFVTRSAPLSDAASPAVEQGRVVVRPVNKAELLAEL